MTNNHVDSAMQSISQQLSLIDAVLGDLQVDQLNPSERVRFLQIIHKIHDVKEDIEIAIKHRSNS